MTCTECTCAALKDDAAGWNCLRSNNTCQLISNYSSNDGYLMPTTNGDFLCQRVPPERSSTVSITTVSTESTSSATSSTGTSSTTSTTRTSATTSTTRTGTTPTRSTTFQIPSTTSTARTTTTTQWDCIAHLAGATPLLNLVNVSSQSYVSYSYTYAAVNPSTRITLSFRMDSNNWSLDTVSAIQSGTTAGLLTNGDFHIGDATGWSSCNPYNATNTGFVINDTSNAQSGYFYWKDGSRGAADYLYYDFPTNVGSYYTVSFYLKSGGGLPNSAQFYIGP